MKAEKISLEHAKQDSPNADEVKKFGCIDGAHEEVKRSLELFKK